MKKPDHAELRMSFLLSLRERGIRNTALLRAFEIVKRTDFIGHVYADLARDDISLPIGCGQSQTAPSSLALMLDALTLRDDHHVLEIGTGSGYGTAILSKLVKDVVTVERYKSLTLEAAARFQSFGLQNISSHHGDGRFGVAGQGPFDRILIDAALLAEPLDLLSQLQPNGILIAIRRGTASELVRYRKVKSRFEQNVIGPMDGALLLDGIARAM